MKVMKVSFIQPAKQLSPYVALIWVFESRSGVPLADSRIIVPDCRAKSLFLTEIRYAPLSIRDS